jgi:cysteine-rich CWC protein
MTPMGDRVTATKPVTPRNTCAPTQKKCSACGQLFDCGAPDAGCWCEDVKLTAEALESLRMRYADCLCSRCLATAQKFGGSPLFQQGEGALQRSVKKLFTSFAL